MKRCVIIELCFLSCLCSWAQSFKDVSVTKGGELRLMVTDEEAKNITSLKVSGPLSEADIDFIGKILRANAQLSDIDLSGVYGLSKVKWGAFRSCSNLCKITLPRDMERLGDFAFSGCSRLCYVSLPPNLSLIGLNAFSGCLALSEIVIPKNVSKIETEAFKGCLKLKKITLLGNTELGKNVFSDCLQLFDIICKSPNPPLCAEDPFEGVNVKACAVRVPALSISSYQKAKYWKKFKFIYPL